MTAGDARTKKIEADRVRAANLARANEVRFVRAGVKEDLRSGQLTLPDLILRPPSVLADLPLWEVLRLSPGLGTERCAVINRRAVEVRINLAVPLGRASDATRRWLSATLAERHATSAQRTRRRTPGSPFEVAHEDSRAEQLAEAIAQHRTAVRGPGPVDAFGAADDALYDRCAEIMATQRRRRDKARDAA